MKPIIYLGDEAEAAGFRLAGVEARVLQPETAQQALAAARTDAVVLLVGERWAGRLPLADLADGLEPLLLVVGADDLSERLSTLLGRVS